MHTIFDQLDFDELQAWVPQQLGGHLLEPVADERDDVDGRLSAVERAGLPTINEGDRLEFEIEVDRRGKYAPINLSPLQVRDRAIVDLVAPTRDDLVVEQVVGGVDRLVQAVWQVRQKR